MFQGKAVPLAEMTSQQTLHTERTALRQLSHYRNSFFYERCGTGMCKANHPCPSYNPRFINLKTAVDSQEDRQVPDLFGLATAPQFSKLVTSVVAANTYV